MARRDDLKWLVKQPLWWLAQLQALVSFGIAVAPSTGTLHRILAAFSGLLTDILATKAMFVSPPRKKLEQMTERQRAKVFREHPEVKARWLQQHRPDPPPLPPAPTDDDKKGGA